LKCDPFYHGHKCENRVNCKIDNATGIDSNQKCICKEGFYGAMCNDQCKYHSEGATCNDGWSGDGACTCKAGFSLGVRDACDECSTQHMLLTGGCTTTCPVRKE
jgi:hypothetical protein